MYRGGFTEDIGIEVRPRRRTYNVEYEGLQLIYFHCGKYGHRKEMCSKIICTTNKNEPGREHKEVAGLELDCREPPGEEHFGPWMLPK